MKKLPLLAIALVILVATFCVQKREPVERPNILFCVADDQSFPHAGAYGCEWVKTPAFDKVAANGLLFTNAYTANAKCAPSRAIILTGRYSWQLEEAASHVGFFPNKFKTVFETLSEFGYNTGRTAKGWAPGVIRPIDGQPRELIGQDYSSIMVEAPTSGMDSIDYASNFDQFLDEHKEGEPFAFWYGGTEPHRFYEYGSGIKYGGKKLSDIDKVPGYWIDTDSVRTDMLDYAYEIEYFDTHLGRMIASLEKRGMLDNTIIVVTADNGMPFPRCKAQEYPSSCHLPLAIMWPKGVKKPGRTITDFVSFIDFAATWLDIAGISEAASGMQAITGKSLRPIFESEKMGRVVSERDFVLVGKERHDTGRPDDMGYPIRAIITDDFTYLRNFKPERWPTGQPETGYLDCDGSPTKTQMLNTYGTDKHRFWQYSFGKKPMEEFYDLSADPDCLDNAAQNEALKANRDFLKAKMFALLEEQGDPRVLGNGDVFDAYPIMPKQINFYERFMSGEKMNHSWVNDTDFRPEHNPDFKR